MTKKKNKKDKLDKMPRFGAIHTVMMSSLLMILWYVLFFCTFKYQDTIKIKNLAALWVLRVFLIAFLVTIQKLSLTCSILYLIRKTESLRVLAGVVAHLSFSVVGGFCLLVGYFLRSNKQEKPESDQKNSKQKAEIEIENK